MASARLSHGWRGRGKLCRSWPQAGPLLPSLEFHYSTVRILVMSTGGSRRCLPICSCFSLQSGPSPESPVATSHPAIAFPFQGNHRHSLQLSRRTLRIPVNGQPYELLQRHVLWNEPLLSQSRLMTLLPPKLHLLRLFCSHRPRQFQFSTVVLRPKPVEAEHQFYYPRASIHAEHNRRPIPSIDSAAPFPKVRRDVLQQIVCLALPPCSDSPLPTYT